MSPPRRRSLRRRSVRLSIPPEGAGSPTMADVDGVVVGGGKEHTSANAVRELFPVSGDDPSQLLSAVPNRSPRATPARTDPRIMLTMNKEGLIGEEDLPISRLNSSRSRVSAEIRGRSGASSMLGSDVLTPSPVKSPQTRLNTLKLLVAELRDDKMRQGTIISYQSKHVSSLEAENEQLKSQLAALERVSPQNASSVVPRAASSKRNRKISGPDSKRRRIDFIAQLNVHELKLWNLLEPELPILAGFAVKQIAFSSSGDFRIPDTSTSLQHLWYPQLMLVDCANGAGTIERERDILAEDDNLARGGGMDHVSLGATTDFFIPENPLNSCARDFTLGGFFAIPETADTAGGADGLSLLGERWCTEVYKNAMMCSLNDNPSGEASNTHVETVASGANDREDQLVGACRSLPEKKFVTSAIASAISSRTGAHKRSFLFVLLKNLRYPSGKLTDLSMEERKSVASIFGGGEDMKSGSDLSFGAWRLKSFNDLSATLCLQEASRGGSDVTAGPSCSLPVEASTGELSIKNDLLFCNDAARLAYVSFSGRATESDRTNLASASGSTSITTLARADAWISVTMSFVLAEATADNTRGKSGARNSGFNALYSKVYPRAVESLLRQCRDVLKSLPYGDSELKKPFLYKHLATRLDGIDGPDDEARQCAIDELDSLSSSRVPFERHQGDVYETESRIGTVAFFNIKEMKEYVVLKSDWFKSNVSSLLGNVADAYVGVCSPEELDYGEMRGQLASWGNLE